MDFSTDEGAAASGAKRPLSVSEPRDIPPLSLLLGSAAMAPIVAGAVAVWVLPGSWTTRLTLIWAASILAFLGGVRRGLSFRTPGGARIAQLATMLWLFALAFAASASPWPLASALLLIAGFSSIAVLDPAAAPARDVPPFFARLRPVQMAVPTIALIAIAARIALSSPP